MYTMKGVVLAVLVMMSLAGTALADELTYEQGIHVVRPDSRYINQTYYIPEYLSVEDLIFVSCLEDEDVVLQPSVMCLDNNNFQDLEPHKWTKEHNCYIASMNLDGFECKNIRLQAAYEVDGENLRLTKDLRVNKLSKVLDKLLETQFSDGGWRTTRDTAYGIWALSQYPEIFNSEMEHALSWLEMERNEEKKCWPKSPCNVPLSLEILYTLTLSGYDDARRVVNDARNWIESLQNFYEQGDTFSVELEAFVPNASVVLAARNDELLDSNFSITNGTKKKYYFPVYSNDTLYVISPENFQAVIRNKYGVVIHVYQGSNLSYEFDGACWSANKKGEPCNSLTTAYATQLDLHEKNLIEARRWMFSEVNHSDLVGAYYGRDNSTLDTSLFLALFHNQTDYSIYEPNMVRYDDLSVDGQYDRYMEDILNWLLFKQNNEGSWGVSNSSTSAKSIPSALAVHSLITMGKNRTFEPIEDAERWMSDNEELLDRNDTVALGSAFYVLRNNARPLIVARPSTVQIKEAVTSLEIYNPTTFNLRSLTYNLSEELEDYLTVDRKEQVSAYSYRKVNIRRKENPTNDVYGFLEIANMGQMITKIPVVITDYPTINVTVEDSVTVFGTKGKFRLNAKKSAHEFLCSIDWDSPEISSPSTFKFSKSTADVSITFSSSISKEDVYKGTLNCKARDQEFNMPISLYVTRYSSYPISVRPDSVFINGTGMDIIFYVKNNLDVDLTPQISAPGVSEYFTVPDQVVLNPNEEKNITVTNLMPGGINYTDSITISVEALGKIEQVSAVIDISAEPEEEANMIVVFTIFLAVFFFLSGLAYLIYKNRDKVLNFINRFNVVKAKQDVKESIDKLEKVRYDERRLSIVNMLQLLKFQKKSDEEIKKIMLDNFSLKDLKEVSDKENLAIKGLEEEEPEEIKR